MLKVGGGFRGKLLACTYVVLQKYRWARCHGAGTGGMRVVLVVLVQERMLCYIFGYINVNSNKNRRCSLANRKGHSAARCQALIRDYR